LDLQHRFPFDRQGLKRIEPGLRSGFGSNFP
jgi:hypothetical protein